MDTSLSGFGQLVQEQLRLHRVIREALRVPALAELRISLEAARVPSHLADISLTSDLSASIKAMEESAATITRSIAQAERQAAALWEAVRLSLPSAAPPSPLPLTYSELNERLASLSEGMYAPPADDDDDDDGEYAGGHNWGFVPPTV